eukprot:437038-Prymnesium_polylepis.1
MRREPRRGCGGAAAGAAAQPADVRRCGWRIAQSGRAEARNNVISPLLCSTRTGSASARLLNSPASLACFARLLSSPA